MTRTRIRNAHPRMTPRLERIERALGRISKNGGRPADIIFTDDANIAELAGRFRGSPYPTDVLAFPYDDDPALAGEVVVSLDTAKRQAKERGVDLTDELILLCVHGLLHIAGHRDETEKEWKGMRMMEFETLMRVL